MSASGGRSGLSLIAFASERFDSISATTKAGIMGSILAVFTLFIDFWIAVADLFLKSLTAMGDALAQLVTAIFGSPAEIIIAGAQETINSLLTGFSAGPLSFALAIASVLLGLYIVNQYVALESTGNLLPGLPFDVPTPGFEDPEEEKEDG